RIGHVWITGAGVLNLAGGEAAAVADPFVRGGIRGAVGPDFAAKDAQCHVGNDQRAIGNRVGDVVVFGKVGAENDAVGGRDHLFRQELELGVIANLGFPARGIDGLAEQVVGIV